MGWYENLVGKRFGKLTVIQETDIKYSKHRWLCKCDCGGFTTASTSNLKSGHSTTCGCYRKTHGETGTRLYGIWTKMRTRCLNPKAKEYKYYGGRGINICKEWNEFEKFQSWAFSHGYSYNLTIDRINCDGNYEPSNCRWATKLQQVMNRRITVHILYKGQDKTLRDWCLVLGINYNTAIGRYMKGFSPDKILCIGKVTRSDKGSKKNTKRSENSKI